MTIPKIFRDANKYQTVIFVSSNVVTNKGVTAISDKDFTPIEPQPVKVGEFQSQKRTFLKIYLVEP